MASILIGTIPWHDGEQKMHSLLRLPPIDNPTHPYLTPAAGFLVKRAPLFALGTLDDQGRPWSTVWGGEGGFATPVSESIIEVRSLVDAKYDPVLEALLHGSNEKVGVDDNTGKMVSALGIDLETRKRVKLDGKMISASLEQDTLENGMTDLGQQPQARLALKIETSLGNCPKYLNKKHVVPARPEPTLISDSPQLPSAAIDLLNRADCMFLTTFGKVDMDTNYRGGPPGFVRVSSNEASGAVLVYPEYSGNRLYQTLGNMQMNPLAGFVFPDFETGDSLYATGTTEVLVGKNAASVLPRSKLAVRITLSTARFVEKALSFRGIPGQPSPYTPSVRFLPTEKSIPAAQESPDSSITATLVQKEELTPTITRFRFRISDPSKTGSWIPGQYATLSFAEELDMGYSHMRDEDPASLNDDYVRTFTISSYPPPGTNPTEFEITVRKHGNVTSYLFRTSERAGLEVPLRGFGGSFQFELDNDQKIIPFIAGGIGITPVIAQLPGIDISRLRLFWSVVMRDVGLVVDTFRRFPDLPSSTTLFMTGPDLDPESLDRRYFDAICSSKARVERRRMERSDLDLGLADVWYLCAGSELKRSVLEWLAQKRVVYEDFSY